MWVKNIFLGVMLLNLCGQIFILHVCCNYTQIWKTTKIFGILGVMAKALYGYWSSYPCLVGVIVPNVARMSIIEAEKHTRIDITCGVTINDELRTILTFLNM